MLGDVLKGSLDCGWYRGRRGQVSTLRLESVLVGYVRDLKGLAVGVGIAVAASCLQGLILGTCVVEVTIFLDLDAITGLVAVAIDAVRVRSVQSLLDDRNLSGVVKRGGNCHCHEDAQSDCLKEQEKNIVYAEC